MTGVPATLDVGPFRYAVVVGGPAYDRHRAEHGEPDLMGRAQHHTLEVAIRPGLAAGAEREVLVHELLHCCFNAAGQPMPAGPEEDAVRALAPTLLAALRANPELVAYLLGPT